MYLKMSFQKKHKTYWVYVTMFLLYTFSFNFFLEDVKGFTTFVFFLEKSLNLNLLNGAMLIHPILLYSSYVCLVLFSSNTFIEKKINTETKKLYLIIYALLYLTIILGSWWAEQELAWGGWWSWDFVEVLLLNIILFNLYLIHQYKIRSKKLVFAFITTVLFSTTAVRFNVINSIHNFITTGGENQHYLYMCTCMFFFCILYYTTSLKTRSLFNVISLFYLYMVGVLFIYLILFFLKLVFNLDYTWVNINQIYTACIVLILVYVTSIKIKNDFFFLIFFFLFFFF